MHLTLNKTALGHYTLDENNVRDYETTRMQLLHIQEAYEYGDVDNSVQYYAEVKFHFTDLHVQMITNTWYRVLQ